MSEAPEFAFNFLDADVKADPYPLYAEMRAAGRVVRNPFLLGQFMVSHYDDVAALFGDSATFGMGAFGENPSELLAAQTMLNTDPPDHERLRGVVARAFTTRSITGLEARIREVTDELLTPLADGAPFDVVSGLADRLPVLMIAELLGVGTSDLDDFIEWSHGLLGGIDMLASPETREHAIRCSKQLHDLFADEIARRRALPTSDDLIGRLVEANEDGRLSEDEMLSSCVLLLLGGNETTTKLITNGVLALARHPDERARLVAQPQLLPTAIEECLRYDTPVQGDPRIAMRDVGFAGVAIPKGSLLVGLLGSANRDPARFSDPDRFDVARDPDPHLSFGRGIHYCLGANLSRLEARIAIGAILEVAPDFGLAEPDATLRYEGTFFFHAPSSLVVRRTT